MYIAAPRDSINADYNRKRYNSAPARVTQILLPITSILMSFGFCESSSDQGVDVA